jgi:hypothetical protein
MCVCSLLAASRIGIGAHLLVKYGNGRVEECFKEHRCGKASSLIATVHLTWSFFRNPPGLLFVDSASTGVY